MWRWALDFDFDIFLKGKKDGHPLFIQQCACGVALGGGCWALGAGRSGLTGDIAAV